MFSLVKDLRGVLCLSEQQQSPQCFLWNKDYNNNNDNNKNCYQLSPYWFLWLHGHSKTAQLNLCPSWPLPYLDKEKAFARVDRLYLFRTLEAFRFGENFLSGVKLLYWNAAVLLKIKGGLSRPILLWREIRQGYQLSGMLYAFAV